MNVQLVPDRTQMRRYLEQGLSQSAIVKKYEEDTGIRVSRPAIGMAIARYGLSSANRMVRDESLMPWAVRPEHRMDYNARMLRCEARRRAGAELRAEDLRKLTQWLDRLNEQNAVVTYEPRSKQGFFWVVRTDEDADIIRRP